MPVSSKGKVDNFVLKMIAKNITKAKRCDNLPIILPNYFLHSIKKILLSVRLALTCNTWRYQDLWCLPVRKARGIIKWYLHTYCNQTSVTFKSLERRYGKFLSVVALRWAALPVVTHGR